jgi:ABC-type transport system substrate-binding protein
MTTQHEANIINAERKRMADAMTEQLQKLGVDVSIQHYSGDSSYPTEYTISFQGIRETGPTFDMALLAWISKLIEVSREPASSYKTMISALTSLSHGISSLRTDILDIKSVVVKDSDE